MCSVQFSTGPCTTQRDDDIISQEMRTTRFQDTFPVTNTQVELLRYLAGDDGLDIEAEHGKHSKASILDFFNLQLGEGLGILSEAERIEAAAGVVLRYIQTLETKQILTENLFTNPIERYYIAKSNS